MISKIRYDGKLSPVRHDVGQGGRTSCGFIIDHNWTIVDSREAVSNCKDCERVSVTQRKFFNMRK